MGNFKDLKINHHYIVKFDNYTRELNHIKMETMLENTCLVCYINDDNDHVYKSWKKFDDNNYHEVLDEYVKLNRKEKIDKILKNEKTSSKKQSS